MTVMLWRTLQIREDLASVKQAELLFVPTANARMILLTAKAEAACMVQKFQTFGESSMKVMLDRH